MRSIQLSISPASIWGLRQLFTPDATTLVTVVNGLPKGSGKGSKEKKNLLQLFWVLHEKHSNFWKVQIYINDSTIILWLNISRPVGSEVLNWHHQSICKYQLKISAPEGAPPSDCNMTAHTLCDNMTYRTNTVNYDARYNETTGSYNMYRYIVQFSKNDLRMLLIYCIIPCLYT